MNIISTSKGVPIELLSEQRRVIGISECGRFSSLHNLRFLLLYNTPCPDPSMVSIAQAIFH